MGRRGFKHHTTPTLVYVYIHPSKEDVGTERFVGMVKQLGAEAPRITVNTTLLATLGHAPATRAGLSEAQRKEVFKAAVRAERRATRDAQGQVQLETQLRAKYEAEVAAEYGITTEQLLELSFTESEGSTTVLLVNTGISTDGRRDAQDWGWRGCLDQLGHSLPG